MTHKCPARVPVEIEAGVVEHLHAGLLATTIHEKNFHIRQALQHLED